MCKAVSDMVKNNLKLKHAPLAMSLAQVRFQEVAKMEEFALDIQDILRKRDFPVMERHEDQEIAFVVTEKGFEPQATKKTTFNFLNRNRTESISLGKGHLSLSVSDYSNFTIFSGKLETALNALKRIAEPSLVTRIGFRHVNLLDTANPKATLVGGLRGFDGGSESLETKETYTLHRKGGNKSLRILVETKDSKNYLPESVGDNMKVRPVRTEGGLWVLILDIDRGEIFESPYQDFIISDILSKLDDLHTEVNDTFLQCVTKEALRMWGRTTK
jgi:uncharacterized protein (TIGR04255 family)